MSGPRYDLVPHIGGTPASTPEVPESGEYVPDRRFFRNNPLLCFLATLVVLWLLGKVFLHA